MALHFVSTSVLTSEDGIQFSKEESLETEEAKKLRQNQERQANKPLYLQLAERQDEKQIEYDKVTKLINAPPKGLDEEEYEFLHDLEESKKLDQKNNKIFEDHEIEMFKIMSKTSNIKSLQHSSLNEKTPSIIPILPVKIGTNNTAVPFQVVRKRKINYEKSALSTPSGIIQDDATTKKITVTQNHANALSMLGDYPDDDDDDD